MSAHIGVRAHGHALCWGHQQRMDIPAGNQELLRHSVQTCSEEETRLARDAVTCVIPRDAGGRHFYKLLVRDRMCSYPEQEIQGRLVLI